MRKKTLCLLLLLMVRPPLADASQTTNTVISPEPHSARFPPPAELTLDPGEEGIYTVTITETAKYRFDRSEVTVLEETDTMLYSIQGGGKNYTIRVTNNGPWPGRTVVKVEAWWNEVSDTEGDGDGDGTGGEEIYGVATNIAIAGLLFEIQAQTDPGDIVCVGCPDSSVILKSVLFDGQMNPHDANSIWTQQPNEGTPIGTVAINPASGTQVTVTGETSGYCDVIATLNIQNVEHPPPTATNAMTIIKVELGMNGVADADKKTIGGFVSVNANNDNGSPVINGIPAIRDFDTSNYTDNDLVQISLQLEPTTGVGGQLRLSKVEAGRDRIRIWKTTGKVTEVLLPKSWEVGTDTIPSTLQVEGLKEGKALREIDLVLEYLEGGTVICDDKVKVTVTPVLKKLEVVASTLSPDYFVGTDGLEMLWSNGGWGDPSVALNAEAHDVTNPSGKLRPIQHVSNTGNLAGGAGVVNWETTKGIWDFKDPHKGKTLVDGVGVESPFDPFYYDDETATYKFSSDDTPRIWVGFPLVLPPVDKSTEFDQTQNFTIHAVWHFSDGTVYFLGSATWSVRYAGYLKNTSGTITFDSGENNKITGSAGFMLENTDQDTSGPSATSQIQWRTP